MEDKIKRIIAEELKKSRHDLREELDKKIFSNDRRITQIEKDVVLLNELAKNKVMDNQLKAVIELLKDLKEEFKETIVEIKKEFKKDSERKDERLQSLERWRYILLGGLIVAGFMGNKISDIIISFFVR